MRVEVEGGQGAIHQEVATGCERRRSEGHSNSKIKHEYKC